MQPSVLIVGSGSEKDHGWIAQGYTVTTLDIEPETKPDIVASMTDMGEIGEFDVVYCCHALEHLYPHDVPRALAEFRRVLKPNGRAVILVPDLEGVEPTEKELPCSAWTTTGLHLFYGDASQIERFPFMAHHCGFVKETLKEVLEKAGFTANTQRIPDYNLLGIGIKEEEPTYWAV